jgi:hypothetical protein
MHDGYDGLGAISVVILFPFVPSICISERHLTIIQARLTHRVDSLLTVQNNIHRPPKIPTMAFADSTTNPDLTIELDVIEPTHFVGAASLPANLLFLSRNIKKIRIQRSSN